MMFWDAFLADGWGCSGLFDGEHIWMVVMAYFGWLLEQPGFVDDGGLSLRGWGIDREYGNDDFCSKSRFRLKKLLSIL